jgi:CBS domain-containing protein
MPDVIYEMSRKKLGMTAVVAGDGLPGDRLPGDRLLGVISDGDLRRLLEERGKDALDLTAEDCMTRAPKTIGAQEFAATALARMEEMKITSLVVVERVADGQPALARDRAPARSLGHRVGLAHGFGCEAELRSAWTDGMRVPTLQSPHYNPNVSFSGRSAAVAAEVGWGTRRIRRPIPSILVPLRRGSRLVLNPWPALSPPRFDPWRKSCRGRVR